MASTSKSVNRFRQILTFAMILSLGFTMVACEVPTADSYANQAPQNEQVSPSPTQSRIADGQYPIQQVTYDDATGEYSVMLLNTAPGQDSVYRSANLPMARLTDEEISSNQESYLKVEQGQPALHLDKEFRIEYVHNVTENVTNQQTGQPEAVVVRRETGFWAPFAGALAGQAIGSLLFTPHYYFPPVYRPGVVLVGYGGYGRTYDQAINRYRTRYQAPPAEVRNRQTLRTAGRLRNPGFGSTTTRTRTRQVPNDRATGSGYGSTNLRRDRYNRPSGTVRRTPSFGSGGRTRSLGRRRR